MYVLFFIQTSYYVIIPYWKILYVQVKVTNGTKGMKRAVTVNVLMLQEENGGWSMSEPSGRSNSPRRDCSRSSTTSWRWSSRTNGSWRGGWVEIEEMPLQGRYRLSVMKETDNWYLELIHTAVKTKILLSKFRISSNGTQALYFSTMLSISIYIQTKNIDDCKNAKYWIQ